MPFSWINDKGLRYSWHNISTCLHHFLLASNCHEGDTEGATWSLHKQWACFTAEVPMIREPGSLTPHRKQICHVPQREALHSSSKAVVPLNILEKTARNRRTVRASLIRHAESQELCLEIEESFLEDLPNFKNKLNTRQRSGRENTWESGNWVNEEDVEVEWGKAQGQFGITTE